MDARNDCTSSGFVFYLDTCKDTDCSMSEVRTYALREGKLVTVYVHAHKTRDH